MEFDAFTAVAATVGELTCGCPFDRDGLHRAGDWVQCRFHRAPAPVARRITVTTAGAVLGASSSVTP